MTQRQPTPYDHYFENPVILAALRRYAFGLTRTADAGEELYANAVAHLWKKVGEGKYEEREGHEFQDWAVESIYNMFRSIKRKELCRDRRAKKLEDYSALTARQSSPDEKVQLKEVIVKLCGLDSRGAAMIIDYVFGYSTDEICERHATASPQAVKSCAFHARQKLEAACGGPYFVSRRGKQKPKNSNSELNT
ncbi:MAG: hypothetical protein SFW62_01825 [Alphaproteobacteria bacterium]|nr:hypothetical protein [Alphaproteobacteria bacterium]